MRKLTLYVAVSALGVGLLTGAGSCASSALNSNGKSDDNVQQKMGTISLGASEDEVRSMLGSPNHTQQTNTSGYQSDCWYYGSTDSWQLCFDNGLVDHHSMSLTSKNHY
jgi:hypothetical protein